MSEQNPTMKGHLAGGQPPRPTCPKCGADPLVMFVVDGELPGTGMIVRQIFCSEMTCRALISVFPIAIKPQPPAHPSGGSLLEI